MNAQNQEHPIHLDLDALPSSSLLSDPQTAELLGIAPATLAVWRCTGRVNLPFVKIGRHVRYRVGDIRKFIENRTFTHTGEVRHER